MEEIANSFNNLLDTISLAQISIEKTSRFILKNPQHIDPLLNMWQLSVRDADEKKLLCLLYLANDVIQKVKPQDKVVKEKFAHCLLNYINYFNIGNICSNLVRILKIWADRGVLIPEIIAKFKSGIGSKSPNITDPLVTTEVFPEYDASRLIGYLYIYQEMNNVLTAFKSTSTQSITSYYTKELHKIRVSNDVENCRKHLAQLILEKKKNYNQFQEIKEAIINCRLQTSYIAGYRHHYNNALVCATKTSEEYSEYRSRIIQLRWRIEKVKQKMVEKVERQINTYSNISGGDINDVADMEVENEDERDRRIPESAAQQYIRNKDDLAPYSMGGGGGIGSAAPSVVMAGGPGSEINTGGGGGGPYLHPGLHQTNYRVSYDNSHVDSELRYDGLSRTYSPKLIVPSVKNMLIYPDDVHPHSTILDYNHGNLESRMAPPYHHHPTDPFINDTHYEHGWNRHPHPYGSLPPSQSVHYTFPNPHFDYQPTAQDPCHSQPPPSSFLPPNRYPPY